MAKAHHSRICEGCGTAYTPTQERPWQRFCSHPCSTRARRQPPEVRFWPNVIQGVVPSTRPDLSPCWLWTGTTNGGYGSFTIPHENPRPYRTGRSVRAHRWAYEYLIGPIPEGLDLDHLCRTLRCVNPNHLEPVTRGENQRRGTSLWAQNARKTHCRRGHPFTPENILDPVSGRRECRECKREHGRQRRRRLDAA